MGNTLVQLLIGLISGGVGGNIAGAILKKYSLGPLGNTIVGLLGGGIGEQLFNVAGMLPSPSYLVDFEVGRSFRDPQSQACCTPPGRASRMTVTIK